MLSCSGSAYVERILPYYSRAAKDFYGAEREAQRAYERGMYAIKKQEYSRALYFFREARRKNKRNANILYMIAYTQYKLGMNEQAIQSFQKAQRLNPKVPQMKDDVLDKLTIVRKISFELVSSGTQIILSSQRYIMGVFLALFYSITEQKTNMRYSIRKSSLDRLKAIIFVVIIAAIAFGVVYMPLKYSSLHTQVTENVNQIDMR